MQFSCGLIFSAIAVVAAPLSSQQRDSIATRAQPNASAPSQPAWRDSIRYGGGPSVGAPPSDYTGEKAPSAWCLQTTGRAPGDFGRNGTPWMQASRSWLRQILSDTTDHGEVWRTVLGGAPQLAAQDSIEQVLDEQACREVAHLVNSAVLGWPAGPPPVVIFRVHDYLIAFPSNAAMGHFGLAVGMTPARQIQGVAAW